MPLAQVIWDGTLNLETLLIVGALLAIAATVWKAISALITALVTLTGKIEQWDRAVESLKNHVDAHTEERAARQQLERQSNDRR